MERLKEFVYLKPNHLIFSRQGTRKLVGQEHNGVWKVRLQPRFGATRLKPEISINFVEMARDKTKLIFEFQFYSDYKAFILLIVLVLLTVVSGIIAAKSSEIWPLVIPLGGIGMFFTMIHLGFGMEVANDKSYLDNVLKEINTDANKSDCCTTPLSRKKVE